jgi:hypothetical protein
MRKHGIGKERLHQGVSQGYKKDIKRLAKGYPNRDKVGHKAIKECAHRK